MINNKYTTTGNINQSAHRTCKQQEQNKMTNVLSR